jgi:hypothetical protein
LSPPSKKKKKNFCNVLQEEISPCMIFFKLQTSIMFYKKKFHHA